MKDRFIVVFISAVVVTALCGILMVAIAIFGPNPQPPPTAAVFDTFKYGFTVGMLTIFGLLSTRSPRTSPTNRS